MKTIRLIRCLPILAILCTLASSRLGAGLEVPFLGGRVNDNANLLTGKTSAALESMLKIHEDSTSNQVVVLTITSLEGEEIEPYAIRVAETWKLGKKGKDNGVLLVVAKDDRKVRIEVGRGLEGDLTDLTCGRIIRHEIIPRFKEGDYDGGIRAGVETILAAIQGSYVADEGDGGDLSFGDTGINIIVFLFFLVVITPFTLIAFFTRGFPGWFLYFFLIPFYGTFPMVSIGGIAGGALLITYLIGMPVGKILMRKTEFGKNFEQKWGKHMISSSGGSGSSSSGWSWSSGGSSGGSSFSGGGGSFSGGGSSGSW
jgi:uncharacterized protein